jgi:Meiosis protein SPO22/ZIP4 like
MDLAEHFFATTDTWQATSPSAIAEDVVDLFYEIGKCQLDKGRFNMAVKWLKRAFELLQNQEFGSLSPDVSELRLNVLHTYG